MAWLPALTAVTPRARASGARFNMFVRAPRGLKLPVYWNSSSFSTTSVSAPAAAAISGPRQRWTGKRGPRQGSDRSRGGKPLPPHQPLAAAFRLAMFPGIICHGCAAMKTRISGGMLRLESIMGLATDAALAERLHHLEHDGKVEYIHLAGEDTARRRLHVATDRGTDCAILLAR